MNFIFEQKSTVRVLIIGGQPWFVAKDVAEILGYAHPKNMYKLIDKEDKQNVNPQTVENAGLLQNGAIQNCKSNQIEPNPNVKRMTIINESGLYAGIFGSTLSQAKVFKRWVTSEVLPSIRETGRYVDDDNMLEELCPIDIKASIKKAMGKFINESGMEPALAYYLKYKEFGEKIGKDFYSLSKRQGMRPIDWLKINGQYQAFCEFIQ